MTLSLFLILASALFAVGLYGLLSQQSIVMIMMGLELAISGIIVAGAALWYFVVPGGPNARARVVVAPPSMPVEMALGFARTTSTSRPDAVAASRRGV